MVKYNRIYDEEIYKLSNTESKELLNDWILELRSKGRSGGTIKQYTSDAKAFITYTYHNFDNRSVLQLGRRDFRNFFLHMSENGLSSARINRMQSSIRNLLAHAEMDDEYYPEYVQNPMMKVKGLEKSEVRDIVFLSREQVDFLLNYLLEHKRLSEALFFSLAIDSAGRKNELHQVTKEGFLDDGIYKTSIVQGKRGKKFPLMYSQTTKTIAKEYLEERGEDDFDGLWLSVRGEKREVTSGTLYNYALGFRSILESEYKTDIPLNVHSLRHTSLELYSTGQHPALKSMGKDKLDLNMLRILANHSDISTTQGYLKDTDSELLNELFSDFDE